MNRIGAPLILKEQAASGLYAVFTHLFRNSIDHGLEVAALRLANGKQAHGSITIQVEADAEGFTVLYQDDGQGLDLSALQEKAMEQGIWHKAESVSDEDIAALIFESGVSTKAIVTEISGRGVGMAAVRSLVQSLAGRLHIRLLDKSSSGKTSFQFELRFPGDIAKYNSAQRRLQGQALSA